MPSMLPYFDAHCDTISRMLKYGHNLRSNPLHVDLIRSAGYAPRAQFFALFADMGEKMRGSCKSEDEFLENVRRGIVVPTPEFLEKYPLLLECFNDSMEREGEYCLPCRSFADLEQAEDEGKIAAFLSVEGAELLGGLSIEDAYAAGVRMVTLTWNYPNRLGGSCISGGGLTNEGRAFVKRANELGIIIDVSHGSDALFYDVAEVSQKPFIASHSNSRSVHDHRRNLTDDQFSAIMKAEGVVGINLWAGIVSPGAAAVADVIRHIDHYAELGGIENIAIGADFDGCDELPEGIIGAEDIYVLADELIKRDYSDSEVYKIFYNNLRRVIEEVVG